MINTRRNFFFPPVSILLCFIFTTGLHFRGYTQNTKQADKLASAFKTLIQTNNVTISSAKKRCIFQKKQANKQVIKTDSVAKKYDCIVYTKNAQALKEKGIIVNSVLPAFATASATLQQILQMAAMPEVTYIDAPSVDTIND